MISLIVGLIILMFADLLTAKAHIRVLTEHTMLEIWWTILPGVVLVFIAIPSLNLLYFIDEVSTPDLTINSLGHQWY